jgi:hypothetical protein
MDKSAAGFAGLLNPEKIERLTRGPVRHFINKHPVGVGLGALTSMLGAGGYAASQHGKPYALPFSGGPTGPTGTSMSPSHLQAVRDAIHQQGRADSAERLAGGRDPVAPSDLESGAQGAAQQAGFGNAWEQQQAQRDAHLSPHNHDPGPEPRYPDVPPTKGEIEPGFGDQLWDAAKSYGPAIGLGGLGAYGLYRYLNSGRDEEEEPPGRAAAYPAMPGMLPGPHPPAINYYKMGSMLEKDANPLKSIASGVGNYWNKLPRAAKLTAPVLGGGLAMGAMRAHGGPAAPPAAPAPAEAPAPTPEPSLWDSAKGYLNQGADWVGQNPGTAAAGGLGTLGLLYMLNRDNEKEAAERPGFFRNCPRLIS